MKMIEISKSIRETRINLDMVLEYSRDVSTLTITFNIIVFVTEHHYRHPHDHDPLCHQQHLHRRHHLTIVTIVTNHPTITNRTQASLPSPASSSSRLPPPRYLCTFATATIIYTSLPSSPKPHLCRQDDYNH